MQANRKVKCEIVEDLTLESSASSEIENPTRPNLFNESEIVEQ